MMTNFIAQFGQNCNLDYSSVPMFPNENLDTSSIYTYTDWVSIRFLMFFYTCKSAPMFPKLSQNSIAVGDIEPGGPLLVA